jgi:hypothetical protein
VSGVGAPNLTLEPAWLSGAAGRFGRAYRRTGERVSDRLCRQAAQLGPLGGEAPAWGSAGSFG